MATTAILTNVGEEWVVDRLVATSRWIDWGTGAGTAAKGDVALFTVASEARVGATVSKTGTGATAKDQCVGLLTADAGKTITNMGTWSASTAGTLIVHVSHDAIVLALGDKIEYTVTLDPA